MQPEGQFSKYAWPGKYIIKVSKAINMEKATDGGRHE